MEWDICGLLVKKMNRVTVNSFLKIYFTFGLMFGLFTLAAIISLFYLDNKSSMTPIELVCIYAFFVLVLAISFIFSLKSKVTLVIKSIDKIIDDAINAEYNMCPSYEETSLSALEHKMYRFITISHNNTNVIAKERNEIKSLISDISHQTKTPISNILLYSELLLDSDKLNGDEKELSKGIKVQSEKLKWLIDSLVKMSRLETGIISANRTLSPIFKTISNSLGAVFSSAENKNIQIRVCCDENIQTYHDGKWTSEALINILENAIKYTPLNGKIDIKVEQYEIFTRIDISDTGIGINENEINNIFKRFHRCANVLQYEGIGIGLYLTREIISSQGGYIKVKSKVGNGSSFSVFLPNTK